MFSAIMPSSRMFEVPRVPALSNSIGRPLRDMKTTLWDAKEIPDAM
jgi:hypothetical protein